MERMAAGRMKSLLAARVKSADADEIFGFASDEIKSVPTPDEVGFNRRAISSNAVGFIPPPRTDLVAKRDRL